ncbi:MAG: AbrB/MazE/SpoVT family DNA-binding domain-containing protein [Actinomycetota bacterium]|nr:AbrB/MazE/SpoVT family DNA-binding domain-containing protein [Actinomycetota bacterium]
MPVRVRIDRQGRVVIPQQERERLGVREGGWLELVATPEGLLLERRRRAAVTVDDDGLPVVTIGGLETVTNEDAVEAIHRQRDRT